MKPERHTTKGCKIELQLFFILKQKCRSTGKNCELKCNKNVCVFSNSNCLLPNCLCCQLYDVQVFISGLPNLIMSDKYHSNKSDKTVF